jgi:hypothetical protein
MAQKPIDDSGDLIQFFEGRSGLHLTLSSGHIPPAGFWPQLAGIDNEEKSGASATEMESVLNIHQCEPPSMLFLPPELIRVKTHRSLHSF